MEYKDVFFNTAIPRLDFPRPVVLTVNPGKMTNTDFHRVKAVPNLMFVRVRVNTWNECVVKAAIKYYTAIGVPVVLTFMAYFKEPIPDDHKGFYEFRERTLNSYWAIKNVWWATLMDRYKHLPLVYSCGREGVSSLCMHCGNCLREYHRIKESMR